MCPITSDKEPTPLALGPSDKMDPVLEIWIDVDTSPITRRLHGLLDSTTRSFAKYSTVQQ